MSDFFERARLQQQLRDANASLDRINNDVWELNQPPEVRAELQAERAQKAHAAVLGMRVVLGIIATWVFVSLLFGRAGQHSLGVLLSLVWGAFNVLLVFGAVAWVGMLVVRGVRAVRSFRREDRSEERR